MSGATPSIRAMADLATPMSIRVAATLDLAGLAGNAGATAHELAAATRTSSAALRRLLDHLVTIDVFNLDPVSGRYRPTALGAQMREDDPAGVRRLLDINCAGGRAELAFVELLGSVTTGDPAYRHRYGRDFWADLDTRPELRRSFDAQMSWRYQVRAPQIAERFNWSRFPEILDVGGGNGTVLAAILTAHPDVRGRVLDLRPATVAARDRFAEAGLADRAGVVSGSFFDPLPDGADAYLLSDILHDWDDEHARAILTRCRDAAGAHASIVVIESAGADGVDTAFDLFMLMCFGGQQRTVDELAALAADTGLALRDWKRVADGRAALEFSAAPHAWSPPAR